MTTPTIRLFRSTDTGAPTLSGTAGALIAVLDACLKDGYNSKSVQSITRSGSTATVTFAAAHGFAADGLTIVRHAGADQAEYNGDFQISNVTATSYDITVSGTPATPATGTITAKVAPLDWGKPFSGTNKAAYRSAEVTGTRLYLRVDDNNPNADSYKNAFLRGYESMSDVDTGTGLFPTTALATNGIFLNKSSASDATSRAWELFGDGFEFHFFYTTTADSAGRRQFHFGDPASDLLSDPYGALIYGDTAASSGAPNISSSAHALPTNPGNISSNWQSGHYFARASSQLGSADRAGKCGDIILGGAAIGHTGIVPYPAPGSEGLYISPLTVFDSLGPRAQLKGIYQPLHTRPLGHGGLVSAADSPVGHRLYAVKTAGSGGQYGETHVDIDGPWR
jgi:hypothetical protein